MDIGVVTGLVGIATGGLAILTRRQKQRGDAYADARKDRDDCKKRSEAQAAEVEHLKSANVVLTSGVANLRRDHDRLREDCTARDLKAAIDREADRRVIDGLLAEVAGLRKDIGQ